MNKICLLELRQVLLNTANLSWKEWLFLPKDKNWTLNSNCFLFNLDELEDHEEIPGYATENNYDLVLSIADIQGIVDNAHQQSPQYSELDLFKAFLYYFEHDAFISFSK